MIKKILGLVSLILICSNFSFAQSMISLKKYANENKSDLEDPIVQTYILKRCGAAYLYAASITKSKDQATADSLIEAYDKVAVFAGRILMILLCSCISPSVLPLFWANYNNYSGNKRAVLLPYLPYKTV